VGGSTVYRTKRRFVLGNLEAALREEPRPGADRKLFGAHSDDHDHSFRCIATTHSDRSRPV
jgi:hypothetical protein